MFYSRIAKPILFRLDPEKAHDMALGFAKKTNESRFLQNLARSTYAYNDDRLNQKLLGLHFPNPVGIAAGFDKNGAIPRALESIGFGFVEIGSITAKPSKGNPSPRMFRLPLDNALINRMGLNNDGAEIIMGRLDKTGLSIPLGVNIAKTHDPNIVGDLAIDDYVFSYRCAESKADYIMLNVSCPNTAEGITFEEKGPISDLLNAINAAKKRESLPVLVKFSPDLSLSKLDELLDICEQYSIAGYAISNTSTIRDGLKTDRKVLDSIGRGGLSGQPLRDKASVLTAHIRKHIGAKTVIIGVGGIDSPSSAADRIQNGADLVQMYTGLVYEGPSLPGRINRHLVRENILAHR